MQKKSHWRMRLINRAAVMRLTVLFTILGILSAGGYGCMLHMPGKSYHGPFDPLTPAETIDRDQLRRHVEKLATDIGERNTLLYPSLKAAADYVAAELEAGGLTTQRQGFEAGGHTCENIIAEIPGTQRPDEILVIGAHYDGVWGCPAANDNASGVAAMLVLANHFAAHPGSRTLRFIAFVNEEPPFFQTDQMGSLVYAKSCREKGDNIVGMMALETIGYYRDEKGTQEYPFPFNLFYPSTGNFIGFVGNTKSAPFIKDVVKLFRANCNFPSEGASLPEVITGVGWSDHWSFGQAGYPALMVSDTAIFRYPHYHSPQDTAEKLKYDHMARVVTGLQKVIAELTGTPDESE